MSDNVVISIDLGGTYFKAALVDPDSGNILPGSFAQFPSYSEDAAEVVLDALRNVVSHMIDLCGSSQVLRIAVDAPGPFDYSRGACIMKHKFRSVYAVPLAPVMRSVPGIGDIPIQFHHDLHACTYGAWLYDEARDFQRVFCAAVGTGLGTGFLQEGAIVMKPTGDPRYPLFSAPYGEGIVEDIVSNRGLVQAYIALRGSEESLDAREIQHRADMLSDGDALAVYRTMGRVLGSVLRPLLHELQADCLVLGGQIAKGYHLFGQPLQEALAGLECLKHIAPINDIQGVTLRGNAALPLMKYKEKTYDPKLSSRG